MRITEPDFREIEKLYERLKQKCVAAFWKSAGTAGAEIYEEVMACGGDIMKEALRLYREDTEEELARRALQKIKQRQKSGEGKFSRADIGKLINSAVKKAYYGGWKYSEDGEYLRPLAGGEILSPESAALNRAYERTGVVCWRQDYIDLCRCGSIANVFRKMLAMPEEPEKLKTEMDSFFRETAAEQSDASNRFNIVPEG